MGMRRFIHFLYFPFIFTSDTDFFWVALLIYNGVILLKWGEGVQKANYLSMLLGIVILLFFCLDVISIGW